MSLEIGDKVWVFDENRRFYTDGNGNPLTTPWFRGHFDVRYVIKENSKYYYLGQSLSSTASKSSLRVNKKSLVVENAQYGISSKLYVSLFEVDEMCRLQELKPVIIQALQDCNDMQTFSLIRSLLWDRGVLE